MATLLKDSRVSGEARLIGHLIVRSGCIRLASGGGKLWTLIFPFGSQVAPIRGGVSVTIAGVTHTFLATDRVLVGGAVLRGDDQGWDRAQINSLVSDDIPERCLSDVVSTRRLELDRK